MNPYFVVAGLFLWLIVGFRNAGSLPAFINNRVDLYLLLLGPIGMIPTVKNVVIRRK